MANTEIGEVGIVAAGRAVVLRPSLAAMARLGNVVETFDRLHRLQVHPHGRQPGWLERALHLRFLAAVDVLQACAGDQEIFDLTGHQGQRWNSWVPGLIPAETQVTLARSLLAHGVVGVVPEDDRYDLSAGESTHSGEFDPRAIAAMAMAHLGYSEAEAWNLTVTGFTMAMRAKFPPPARTKPTKKEYQATMDWLAEVNKGR